MNDAKYIGLDVHQATISVAVLDSSGAPEMEAILETKPETILQFIRGLRGGLVDDTDQRAKLLRDLSRRLEHELNDPGRALTALLAELGAELLMQTGDRRAEALRRAVLIHASDTVAAFLASISGNFPKRCRHRCKSSRASSSARHRSRTASSASVGGRTSVKSPARRSSTSLRASRRFVLIRSPGFRGMSAGAIT